MKREVTGDESNRRSCSDPSRLRRKSRMASGQARVQGPRTYWGDFRVGSAGGRETAHHASRRLASLGGDRAPGHRGRRSSRRSGLGCREYGLRTRPFACRGRGVVGLGYRTWRPIVRAGVCPALGDTAEVGEERERGRLRHVTNRTPEADGTRKRQFLDPRMPVATSRSSLIAGSKPWRDSIRRRSCDLKSALFFASLSCASEPFVSPLGSPVLRWRFFRAGPGPCDGVISTDLSSSLPRLERAFRTPRGAYA